MYLCMYVYMYMCPRPTLYYLRWIISAFFAGVGAEAGVRYSLLPALTRTTAILFTTCADTAGAMSGSSRRCRCALPFTTCATYSGRQLDYCCLFSRER